MSYGDAHAQVATGLTSLIRAETVPDAAAAPEVLRVREQVRLALIDRLDYLGGRRESEPGVLARGRWVNPNELSKNGPILLRAIVEASHTDPSARNHAPSSVLSSSGSHPDVHDGAVASATADAVRLWRQVAVGLTVGTHDLTEAAEQPWRDHATAAWHLIADAADTVEAYALLDERLTKAGILSRPGRGDHTRRQWDVLGQRAVAASIAREASWEATDPSPDLAHPAIPGRGPGRVRTVHEVADLPTAQARLARLLDAPLTRHDPMFEAVDTEQRISIGAVRTIALGQLRLADAFANLAGSEHPQLREQFAARAAAYETLRTSSSPLRDVQAFPKRAAVVQQSEILQAIRRFTGQHPSETMLLQLNQATHQVGLALGRALRRELLRPDSAILSPREGEGTDRGHRYGYGPVSTGHSVHRAHRQLTTATVPSAVSRFSVSPERAQLRATLNAAPTRLPHRPRPINNARPATGPDR